MATVGFSLVPKTDNKQEWKGLVRHCFRQKVDCSSTFESEEPQRQRLINKEIDSLHV